MKTFLNITNVALFSLLSTSSVFWLQAQERAGYSLSLEKEWGLAGVPLQHPALSSGPVTGVQSGPVIVWKPSFTDTSFGSALLPNSEYYAEVVGPATHPWLGHRFEVNESATRTRTDHALVPAISSWNTKGPINSSIIGATIEVRPHLTLPYLVDDTLLRRIQSGGENPKSFQFFLPFPAAAPLSAQVNLSGSTLLWKDSVTARSLRTEELILPPGSAFGIKFGDRRGLSRGFTGIVRKILCPVPLQKGCNYVSYPFPSDLRLGVDWGSSLEGFKSGSSPIGLDRIELCQGAQRKSYALYSANPRGPARWRLINNTRSDQWASSVEYLEKLDAGEGFLIWKEKADPLHTFRTPKP
jgi:hypothetical protein